MKAGAHELRVEVTRAFHDEITSTEVDTYDGIHPGHPDWDEDRAQFVFCWRNETPGRYRCRLNLNKPAARYALHPNGAFFQMRDVWHDQGSNYDRTADRLVKEITDRWPDLAYVRAKAVADQRAMLAEVRGECRRCSVCEKPMKPHLRHVHEVPEGGSFVSGGHEGRVVRNPALDEENLDGFTTSVLAHFADRKPLRLRDRELSPFTEVTR